MAETTRDAEQVMANIRELNEQILEAGPFSGPRVPGRPTSGRCGRSPTTQDKLADASQSDWLTQMMKAQANSTRDLVSAVSGASRSTLKK